MTAYAPPELHAPIRPQEATIDLSIIIGTRNRAEALALVLDAFTRIQTRYNWELIVVDNGSTDATRDVLARATSTLPLVALMQPKPGLSRAHNAARGVARAPILAFIDDDCYPQPDFIDQVIEVFRSPSTAFMGGRVLLHDPTDLPITIQTRATPLDLPAGSTLAPGILHGANLAFRAEAFDALGGFDELLGPGGLCRSGGDWDLVLRALAAGYHGCYDPGPTVAHHHRRKHIAEQRDLERRYDYGRGAVYLKALRGTTPHRQALRWARQSWIETIRAPRRDLRAVRARLRECAGAWRYLWLSL